MFNSGISVKSLIDELTNEVDIALEIPDRTYISWLNSLQQLLYTEVIKEPKMVVLDATTPISLSLIKPETGENKLIFEDIHCVYANFENNKEVQLKKSTLASGNIFPNTFYKSRNDISFCVKGKPSILSIVYYVRPAIVEEADYSNTNVMLPIEFIDLVKAKLRGEAYKLANEDSLAAKWLNDYNILLETFKAWITEKSPNFGL